MPRISPRTCLPAFAATALLGALVAAPNGMAAGGKTQPGTEYAAEIRRTEFGVPHIKAKDEKGLGFGVGYAYSEDNFCLLADAIVTANGDRSKYFGPKASYDLGLGPRTNLSSDFYYKYLNDAAPVQAAWNQQSQAIQDLLQGYVAGYNRYLKDVGVDALPGACKGQPWVREASVLDIIKLSRQLGILISSAAYIDAFYAAQPPAPKSVSNEHAQAAMPPSLGLAQLPSPLDMMGMREHFGSNGVALGKEATESGAGLLLANPHFPWKSSLRFYQMHLTIPGKMDVMGSSIPGLPLVTIGFNAHVAWTHTVNTSQHYSLFRLELDPADPTRYMLDGKSVAMEQKELSVESLSDQGVQTVKRTYYFTTYGPLLAMPNMEWTTQYAYALRDANADNARVFAQYLAMDKAKSLPEFKHIVETMVGLPWINTLATDKPGNVYYADITPVPNISTDKEKACIPSAMQNMKYKGVFVLDGSRSACQWDIDPAAPQAGIFAGTKLPSMLRADYVQNSNDSAWMTNAAQRLTGFPAIVSEDAIPLSGRTRNGIAQIAARLDGSDGLPGKKFTMASLQNIAFSNRSYFATVMLDDMKAACADAGQPVAGEEPALDISKGCKLIQAWDGKAELDSIGWPLFLGWRTALIKSNWDYWAVPFNAADPVNTPRGLRLNDPKLKAEVRKALAQAMQTLDKQGVDYSKPWGQLQVAVRGDKRIPIHGGVGNDIYNVIASRPLGDGQADTVFGSSAVWMVSYEGASPKIQGFLTYSQSSNPASPYFGDQTERFSAKKWITFPFTEAAIAADPKLTTKRIVQ